MVQELLLHEVVEVTDRLRQSLTAQTTHEDFSDRLNETLNSILPPRFRATRSTITDGMGHSTPELLAVVYDTEKFDATGAASVPANAAIAAFSGHATLDARWFEVAYEEIVTVKSLIKDEPSATASGFHPSNVTLGIIIALDSAEPVERLGEQTDRLNRRHASRQWPDLVVIIERGTVNFAIQFPGEGIIGDFLPPSQGDFLLLPVVQRSAGSQINLCNPPAYRDPKLVNRP